MSLPPRERGLKFLLSCLLHGRPKVAPSAGAWIEISLIRILKIGDCVAPSAGAWIEILIAFASLLLCQVAPSAGAWIEMTGKAQSELFAQVAPSAGAWIEIHTPVEVCLRSAGRSLRGSVD